VERFLALSGGANEGERRLKAALLAVDVLQSAPAPNAARFNSLLAAVAPVVDRLEPGNAAVIEYQYRRLQLAQKANDAQAANKAGESIERYCSGKSYELSGF